jgi:hypothetical protein
MTEEWSPRKKWWLDLFKSLVLLYAVTAVGIVYLERRADKKAFRQYIADAEFEERMEDIRNFRRASYRFTYCLAFSLVNEDRKRVPYEAEQLHLASTMLLDGTGGDKSVGQAIDQMGKVTSDLYRRSATSGPAAELDFDKFIEARAAVLRAYYKALYRDLHKLWVQ